jgi:hypothetical protein
MFSPPLLKIVEFISSSFSANFFFWAGCCTRIWIAALPNYSHYVHGKQASKICFSFFFRKEKKTPVCVCILCRSPLFLFYQLNNKNEAFQVTLGVKSSQSRFFFPFSLLNKRNPRGSFHNTP